MLLAACAMDGPTMGRYTAGHEPALADPGSPMMRPVEDATALADEALAQRLHDRDVRALEALYERHSRALFSLALRLVADQETAEEIVQEAFLKLWQRPDSYVPERGRLLSWLMGVAHHRAVDRLRRRRLELRYSTDHRFAESGPAPRDPEDVLLANLRGEAVIRALGLLPEAQRLVIELAYVRGMTQVEIAEALAEPLGTIKTRMRLAMQKLRASLELAELRPDPS
jgi:RNA polymerase sigma-70 factor, ECF subfamily